MRQPNSRANLDKAIQRLADGDRNAYIAIRAVIANTVVSQMLPEGAVKGGSAIKLRLGNAGHGGLHEHLQGEGIVLGNAHPLLVDAA